MDDFNTDGVGWAETPFNIEEILRADPALYAAWRKRPFYLTTASDGRVILRYLDDDGFAKPGEIEN